MCCFEFQCPVFDRKGLLSRYSSDVHFPVVQFIVLAQQQVSKNRSRYSVVSLTPLMYISSSFLFDVHLSA